MTHETQDGGPAFSTVAGQVVYSHGMFLRDHFAAHAPQMPEGWSAPKSLLKSATRPAGFPIDPESADLWGAYREAQKHNTLMHEVSWRWAYADAMIAARGKP